MHMLLVLPLSLGMEVLIQRWACNVPKTTLLGHIVICHLMTTIPVVQPTMIGLIALSWVGEWLANSLHIGGRCHAPNMFGTVDIGIISPAFRKLKSFFKNIFIGLKHLELRKRKIVDVIPRAGYYEFKKDSDANDMTVQQYYRKTYNIHIK